MVDPVASLDAVDCQDQIEAAIAVEVAEGGPAGPVLAVERVPGEDLPESGGLEIRAVAPAQEQAIAVADEEIGAAVVVQVGDGQAEAEQVVGQAGGGGDVLEVEIAEVPQEDRAGVRDEGVFQDEQVEEAVAVVVEPPDVPAESSPGGQAPLALVMSVNRPPSLRNSREPSTWAERWGSLSRRDRARALFAT